MSGQDRMNEPSVEEILGSIKKIIAENEQDRLTAPRKLSARARTSANRDDVLDLTDMVGEELAEQLPSSQIFGSYKHSEIASTIKDGAASGKLPEKETPLMAAGAARSVRHSLAALAALSEPGAEPRIVRSGETSLEGLARDMLRPMMKEWLDTNLPSLVEQIVTREVIRITRGE